MSPQPTIAAEAPRYLCALQRASQVRPARAELRRRVGVDAIEVADVILECLWQAETMAIVELLRSQCRQGHIRTRRFLAQLPARENKAIGSMTERQRRTLAGMLGEGRVELDGTGLALAAREGRCER